MYLFIHTYTHIYIIIFTGHSNTRRAFFIQEYVYSDFVSFLPYINQCYFNIHEIQLLFLYFHFHLGVVHFFFFFYCFIYLFSFYDQYYIILLRFHWKHLYCFNLTKSFDTLLKLLLKLWFISFKKGEYVIKMLNNQYFFNYIAQLWP